MRNNNDVDSLTNLFTDQADLQFQSTNLESQSAFTWSKLTIETLENGCEVCSKLTIKTPERRHWHRSSVFIVNYEHILRLALVFL